MIRFDSPVRRAAAQAVKKQARARQKFDAASEAMRRANVEATYHADRLHYVEDLAVIAQQIADLDTQFKESMK